MQVESFAALAEPFLERVSAAVWCNMATVDARGRPRSRVVHPVWDGAEGWLGTRRDSFKGRHLALHPAVSLAYVSDPAPIFLNTRRTAGAGDKRQKTNDALSRSPSFVRPDGSLTT